MNKKLMIAVLSLLTSTSIFASGCDSDYFYWGSVIEQETQTDFDDLTLEETKNLIEIFKRKFKRSLRGNSQLEDLSKHQNVRIVEKTYAELDTDCGWSHHGKKLRIVQLVISNEKGSMIFPDVYRDLVAERIFQNSLLKIID